MSKQTRTVKIVVEAVGEGTIKKVVNSLASMNRSLKETSNTLQSMRSFAAGITGASIFGFGARELMDLADGMILTRSRIQAFTGDIDKTNFVLKELVKQANETKSSINDTKEVFSRILTSTSRLNISLESQIALSRILQQSFRLSGSTAAEATASTIQFSQALSFGQLRGQELRSVLSQNSVLANIFGKAIEGSGKDIYKFAEAGGFTTKFVLKVLSEQFNNIEKQANGLSQTFGQTLTLAMNQFQNKVAELNDEFDLNGKFAVGVQTLIDNLETLGKVALVLASATLPLLIAKIVALVTALNPVTLVIMGITAATILVIDNWDKLVVSAKEIGLVATIVFADMADKIANVGISIFRAFGIDAPKALGLFKQSTSKTLAQARIDLTELQSLASGFKGRQVPVADTGDMVTSTIDGASALDAAYKSLKDKAESLEKQIGALNIAFNKGNISVEEYTQKLLDLSIQKFTLDMQEGSKSLKDFNKSTREVEIQNLATQINYGRISLEYFQEVTNRFSAQKLVEEFNTGKISAAALNEELARLQGNLDLMDSNNYLLGFKAGVSKSLLEIGNVATMVTDITSNAFKNFEDNMVSMISESKFDFTSFVDSLLADITRLVVRMAVTAPILQGFMNMMSGGGAGFSFGGGGKVGQVAMPFAKGGAFNSGVQFFANGGVVNSPTLFGHSQGMGVMGEAGPEAILPLKRGADGSLGVGAAGVVINVINQSESEIKTTESTSADGGRMIEIMILGKVKEGFANGSFDQSLKQSFGLQRKGV